MLGAAEAAVVEAVLLLGLPIPPNRFEVVLGADGVVLAVLFCAWPNRLGV